MILLSQEDVRVYRQKHQPCTLKEAITGARIEKMKEELLKAYMDNTNTVPWDAIDRIINVVETLVFEYEESIRSTR